jgi:hypothetical protein
MSCSSIKIICVEYPNLARTFIEKIRMHGQTSLNNLFISDLCYCYCNINVLVKTRIIFCISILERDYSTAESVKSNLLNVFLAVIFYVTLVRAELFHAGRHWLLRKMLKAPCHGERTFCRKEISAGVEPRDCHGKVRDVYHCTPLTQNPSMWLSGKWEHSSE